MTDTMTTPAGILDVLRATIGRRHRITRAEMRNLLQMLSDRDLVELDNDWGGGHRRPDKDHAAAWADMCDDINVISVLADTDAPSARATSSNPGSIRYDQPGSMHPMMQATLMFAPAGLSDSTGEFPGEWLRRRTKRLLVVADDARSRTRPE